MEELSAAEQQLLERIEGIRWCSPDSEMEQLTPAAIEWIENRVEELRGALQAHTRREMPIQLRTTRSLRELTNWWRDGLELSSARLPKLFRSCAQPYAPLLMMPRTQELAALVRKKVVASQTKAQVWSAAFPSLHSAYEPRGEDELSTIPTVNGPDAPPTGRLPSAALPGLAPLVQHVLFVSLYKGAASTLPSPWEPLLAMYERGLFPCVSGNSVEVFVPILGEFGIEEPNEEIKPITSANAEDLVLYQGPVVETILAQVKAGLSIPPRVFTIRDANSLFSSVSATPVPCLSVYQGPSACLSPAPCLSPVRTDPPGPLTRFWNWITNKDEE